MWRPPRAWTWVRLRTKSPLVWRFYSLFALHALHSFSSQKIKCMVYYTCSMTVKSICTNQYIHVVVLLVHHLVIVCTVCVCVGGDYLISYLNMTLCALVWNHNNVHISQFASFAVCIKALNCQILKPHERVQLNIVFAKCKRKDCFHTRKGNCVNGDSALEQYERMWRLLNGVIFTVSTFPVARKLLFIFKSPDTQLLSPFALWFIFINYWITIWKKRLERPPPAFCINVVTCCSRFTKILMWGFSDISAIVNLRNAFVYLFILCSCIHPCNK